MTLVIHKNQICTIVLLRSSFDRSRSLRVLDHRPVLPRSEAVPWGLLLDTAIAWGFFCIPYFDLLQMYPNILLRLREYSESFGVDSWMRFVEAI